MAATSHTGSVAGAPLRPAPRSVRSLLAIDERPALVQLAATLPGRCLLFALFFALFQLALPWHVSLVVCAGAALCAFVREQRERVLLGVTFAALLLDPVWHNDGSFQALLAPYTGTGLFSTRNLQRLALPGCFLLWAALLVWVARHPHTLVARHPLRCGLAALASACACALWLEPGLPWVALVLGIKISAAYLWFLCYAIVDQRAAKHPPPSFSLGTFRPFWGSFSAPIGKGASYLARLRCKTPAELAVTQLKALKLLAWSFVLMGLSDALRRGSAALQLPSLEQLLEAHARGAHTSVAAGWLALIVATALAALELAAWGHRCVAAARLAGFKLRRNTVRPLAARSLADFWNRYYFYFKELLVDFFFYPTFMRCFKRRPRLRVFFATFVAAGVGNALFHFVRDIDLLFSLGPRAALSGFGSYVFYCTLLALGIGISQVRSGDVRTADPSLVERAFNALCVWGFIVCLHPFGGIESRTFTWTERLSFMAHQLGVSP